MFFFFFLYLKKKKKTLKGIIQKNENKEEVHSPQVFWNVPGAVGWAVAGVFVGLIVLLGGGGMLAAPAVLNGEGAHAHQKGLQSAGRAGR